MRSQLNKAPTRLKLALGVGFLLHLLTTAFWHYPERFRHRIERVSYRGVKRRETMERVDQFHEIP
jgi:hypothetical protein